MRAIRARERFMGMSDGKRSSCTNSVAWAFRDKFGVDDKAFLELDMFSGGRAPEGLCGALYAVKLIMERGGYGEFEKIRSAFKEAAGSDKCREIRALKKLSCAECVSMAAELLDKL
jgi:hypothetical protein